MLAGDLQLPFSCINIFLLISQAWKNIWKVLQVIYWAFIQNCWNIVSRICFWIISQPIFYGDLVYKLNRAKCEANDVSSGSKIEIEKSLWRRKYDTVIIERTIGLVLGPSTALYRYFLKYCIMTPMTLWTLNRNGHASNWQCLNLFLV